MATLTIAAGTVLVYVWSLTNSGRVEDVLFLANASLYDEPWRVLTSTFIHRLLPHFAFNLFTLWWFGRDVERRYGGRVVLFIFFSALWVGQLSMLAAGHLPFHGTSGGVCGLYGFLLVADWRRDVFHTLKQQPAYWLYPLALLALFVADRFGLTPVANLNHVVAIGYGGLVGLTILMRTHLALWRGILAMVATGTTLVGGYRFEHPWRHLAAAKTLDCSAERRPVGDVTKNQFVRIRLNDESRRAKSIYYIDSNGEKILLSANNRRNYRLLPYVGSVWRIDLDDKCRVQFEPTEQGIVVVP